MKKLKKVSKSPKSKPKKLRILYRLRKKSQKKTNVIESPLKDIQDILSPKNTTQYLISNNSTSFYQEEEDDLDIDLNQSSSMQIDTYMDLIQKENINLDFKLFKLESEIVSTSAQSQENSEPKLNKE